MFYIRLSDVKTISCIQSKEEIITNCIFNSSPPLPIQYGIVTLRALVDKQHRHAPELQEFEKYAAECEKNVNAQDKIWKHLLNRNFNA